MQPIGSEIIGYKRHFFGADQAVIATANNGMRFAWFTKETCGHFNKSVPI